MTPPRHGANGRFVNRLRRLPAPLGALAIVPCPDAEGDSPVAPAIMPPMNDMAGMAMADLAIAEPVHQHGSGQDAFHDPSCPYAAAASHGGLELGVVALAFVVVLAAVPRMARALPACRSPVTRDRPPSQGPPLPA